MPLQFFMGRPQRDGEYVCYIQDRTQPEWMRPIILHRYEEKWFYPKSNNEFGSGVFGWTGPLPVGGPLHFTAPPAKCSVGGVS